MEVRGSSVVMPKGLFRLDNVLVHDLSQIECIVVEDFVEGGGGVDPLHGQTLQN